VASQKGAGRPGVCFCKITDFVFISMEKTIQFWNDHHAATAAGDQPVTKQEWIYESSDHLFQMILAPLMSNDDDDENDTKDVVQILEIGCGTSTLAADLCDYWNRTYYNNSAPDPQEEDVRQQRRQRRQLTMIATDASVVCIKQQKANNQHPDQCSYEVWNILEPRDNNDEEWKFDLVVDKGCVDTILFRAKKGEELAAIALANIQRCLRTTNSPYCVITSRKKYRKYLAPVFAGRITSQRLDVTQKGDAAIVKKERNDQVFLYVCTTAPPTHGTVESTISLLY
jgi:hypothetical protein